ncbi:orotate phosphoribosyltransferase [Nocardia puris]|uniref:orotate phosphoribosyltransferase n=1 Tax=Nocardia puris TaxID=208602 RepID=UPI001E307163|nr:phosphoribosyltransferase family protein [Nocardia puris]
MMLPVSLAGRIRRAALREQAFILPTGDTLDEYFDEYLLAADPILLKDVAQAMVGHVPSDTDVVMGVAMGGVPLAVALSAVTGRRAGFFRRRPKEYGSCRQIEGDAVGGRHVVIVDDVVRTGSQVVYAAEVLRGCGAEVSAALCVLDREAGGGELLASEGIELRALLTQSLLDDIDFGRPAC